MRGRNFAKPFSIAGLVLGEIYMLYTVLAPYHKGPPVPLRYPLPPEGPLPADLSIPLSVLIFKLSASAIFFGVFGALVGLGVGLLVTGLFAKRTPPAR
jgi:hypothetical protein